MAATSSTPAPLQSSAAVRQIQVIPDRLVVEVGKSAQASATVRYVDNTSDSNLLWTSSDSSIATVNSGTGEISALRSGEVTIIATAARDSNQRAALQLSVRPSSVSTGLVTVNPPQLTLQIGSSGVLQATGQRADGSQSANLSWQTSDSRVAVVNGSGSNATVLAVSPGTATVTVRSDEDISRSASAVITVVQEETP